MQKDGTAINAGIRAAPVTNDWNEDGKKDLIAGSMDGTIKIYINDGSESNPMFTDPYLLQLAGEDFDLGTRTAPRIYDWNKDGLKDLMIGEMEGYIYYLKNIGKNDTPIFKRAEKLFAKNGNVLRYPGKSPRSRLYITDWNNDELDDVLIGGADGKVMLFLSSIDSSSSFGEYFNKILVTSGESFKRILKLTKQVARSAKNTLYQIIK